MSMKKKTGRRWMIICFTRTYADVNEWNIFWMARKQMELINEVIIILILITFTLI